MRVISPKVARAGFATGSNLLPTGSYHIMSPRCRTDEKAPPRVIVSAVSPNQMTSLNAMISYIAHCSGQSEFRIERRLSDRFNVPNAKFLAAADFDNAIRYLADILPV